MLPPEQDAEMAQHSRRHERQEDNAMKNSNKPTPELNAARSEDVSLGRPGPRTAQGKQRTKYNAIKHGIFSSVTVLKGESRAEYQSLLKGLWECRQPQGTLEEVLVEKLATILWRQRRQIRAETAEIRHSTDFLEWDRRNRQHEQAEEIAAPPLQEMLEDNRGWIRKIQNSDVLERCLELLAELRQGIEIDGFEPERDTSILGKIYGRGGGTHLRESPYDAYETWHGTSNASEEERQREGYASPEQCKENILHEIDSEIRHLKRYQKAQASVDAERAELESLRRVIPVSPALDRLLRYQASLERAFDRTLGQLEHLQRMRLSVPPPVKVDVSS